MKQVDLKNQKKPTKNLAIYFLIAISTFAFSAVYASSGAATGVAEEEALHSQMLTVAQAPLPIDKTSFVDVVASIVDDEDELPRGAGAASTVAQKFQKIDLLFPLLDGLPSIDQASIFKVCREFMVLCKTPPARLKNLAKAYRNARYEEIVDRSTRFLLPVSHWYIDLCAFLDHHAKDSIQAGDDPEQLREALQAIERGEFIAPIRLLSGKHTIFYQPKKNRGKDAADLESYVQNTPYNAVIPLKDEVALAMVRAHADFPYVEAQDLADYMKARIIGQDASVEGMASLVHSHYAALGYAGEVGGVAIKKPNMLLAGPTGSGKTEFFRVLEKAMNAPVFIFNATSMSPTSWKGENMDEVISQLYMKAERNKALAEVSVVVFDEFDKILRTHNEDDPKGLHGSVMQRGMLKVVEGDTFVMKDGTTINTHKMLFVFMGSFSGLKGLKKGDISDEALKEYGMIDELRGRISGFFTFKKATEETYRRILVNPNTSPLEAAKLHLRQIPYALRINFTEAAINELASYALLLETGARSLDRCVDKIKQHLIKNIRSLRTAGGSEVVVDASMVRAVLGEKPHILVEEEEEDWGERYRRLGIFM